MLELVLSRDQQSKNFQVDPRLVAAHLRNGLFPVFAEIAQQRANDLLAQLVTRAPQSSGRVAPLQRNPLQRPRTVLDSSWPQSPDGQLPPPEAGRTLCRAHADWPPRLPAEGRHLLHR